MHRPSTFSAYASDQQRASSARRGCRHDIYDLCAEHGRWSAGLGASTMPDDSDSNQQILF